MKKQLLILLLHCMALPVLANHLVGGELFYSYIGLSAQNRPVYKVTLRFFRNMEANVPSIQSEPVYVGVYQDGTSLVSTATLSFNHVDTIRSRSFPSCVSNNLQTVYEVGYFSANVELPRADADYTLAWSRCCRTNSIINMRLNDGGITLTAVIPGSGLAGATPNNSAVFPLRDTVLLCNNQRFALEFGATDADHDSLSYQFSPAYDGASLFDPAPLPNSTISLKPLPYFSPQYTAASPMGSGVRIDARTGQISGVAPPAGTYLVTVRVFEWRNGVVINQHSKDILIKVWDCSYSIAQLKPHYLVCDSTLTIANEFQDGGTSNWFWDFGVSGTTADTSNLPAPVFTYAHAGIYTVTLVTNRGQPCPGVASATVEVFPGLKAGFSVKDSCTHSEVQFTDTTKSANGRVTGWTWTFGDPGSATNTSNLQDPKHVFATKGWTQVTLVAETDRGCRDTASRLLNILPQPALSLPQHQLTGCSGVAMQLAADGVGRFTWSPAPGLSDPHAANPTAAPTVTTTYVVTLDDSRCTSRDSVVLTVLPHDAVTIDPVAPICEGDTVALKARTSAAVYQWSPAGITGSNSLSPVVAPAQTTTYGLLVNAGACETRASVTVTVRPRPQTRAGNDLTVAEGQVVQLNAAGADDYRWWPEANVSDPQIANPTVIIQPGQDSLTLVLTGSSLDGCSASDTVTIYVKIAPMVDAPSAFTPNGDGKNDVFRPVVKGGYQLVQFRVYNRWGQQVFRTNRPYEGWDGRQGLDKPATNTYVWVLEAIHRSTGKRVFRKGTVTLIR